MDVENAHISIHDNSVACVAMEAVLNKKTESEKLYKNCLERVNQIREMAISEYPFFLSSFTTN